MEQIRALTLMDASKRIHEGSLSAVELVRAYTEHYATVGRAINCYGMFLGERALRHAEALDALLALGVDLGPLHGIPIAVKDNVDTAGIPSTSGSPVFAGRVPTVDASIIQRLQAAGGIVLGKANLYEWAYGSPSALFGDVKNPWDENRTAGASSNGSAAAIAAGLAMAAIGTDLGGSIRIPAAMCGVFGLKPTFGLVSRHGVLPLGQTLDHVGPMTRTAADARLMLDVIAGEDPSDPVTLGAPNRSRRRRSTLGAWRVGVAAEQPGHEAGGEVATALERTAAVFTDLGLSVKTIDMPSLDDARTAMWAISAVEGCDFHLPLLREHVGSYSDKAKRLLLGGALIPAVDYAMCQRVRARLAGELDALFGEVDFILSPALRTPAWPARTTSGSATEDDMGAMTHFTPLYNLTGHPAASFPVGLASDGVPVSLQVAAPLYHDVELIELVSAFEQATGIANLHPGSTGVPG